MPLKILVINPDAAQNATITAALEPDRVSVVATPTLEEGLGALLKGGFNMIMLSATFGSPTLTAWWNQAEGLARGMPIVLIGNGDPGGVPLMGMLPTPIDTTLLVQQVRTHLGIRQRPVTPPPPPAAKPAPAPAPAKAAQAPEEPGPFAAFGEVSLAAPDTPATPAAAAASAAPVAPEASTPSDLERALSSLLGAGAPAAPPAAASSADSNDMESEMAGMTPEQVQEIVARIARSVVEKVVWETVPPLVNQLIQERQAEQDRMFAQIVERVVWETVPPMAESIVKQEIRRLSEGR